VYRFLLTPRWLGGAVLAVALSAGCVLLGTWQWDRREQRLAANAPVVENYDADPVPVAAVLPAPDAVLPRTREWTPVRTTGVYVPDETLLVRNRPLDGRPGYHVLVPLRLDAGGVLVVDRGWVPTGQTGRRPDAVPPPPVGDLEVVVRLRRPEPASDRAAPRGQLHRIDLQAVAAALGPSGGEQTLVSGAYGVLDREDPAGSPAPVRLPRPDVDEGPHLSYTFQWFVFAVGALVGYVVLARRTAAELRGDVPAPSPPVRPRRRSAEEEEDALLDAAERARTQG
jgi:cytochrome oxidase assembly protein ShyY1